MNVFSLGDGPDPQGPSGPFIGRLIRDERGETRSSGLDFSYPKNSCKFPSTLFINHLHIASVFAAVSYADFRPQ
jgi:hypothetical protein